MMPLDGRISSRRTEIIKLASYQDGPIKHIYFAGLPVSCEAIEKEFGGLVKTYMGGESAQ